MCNGQRTAVGGAQPLNEAYWHARADSIAAQGQRVLALAVRSVKPAHTVLEHADVEGSLILLGMVGLIDPPRPEAIAAVAECHTAGIRVKMITGDHAGTAKAIARQIGLQNPDKVLTGADLDNMDDAALAAAVPETDIFARTSPEHKLRLVMALLFGMTLPVTPIQILWINLITGITLGIALAFEPTEENTMRRPPRPRNAPLLTGALAWHIVLVAILFLCGVPGIFAYAVDRGYSVELARTIALNTLVVMEIFHLFFIRNIYGTSLTWKAVRGTQVVWLTVIVITVAQFAITYLPGLQAIFATEAVPFLDGLLIIGVGIALFAVIEIEKQLRLRLQAMRTA